MAYPTRLYCAIFLLAFLAAGAGTAFPAHALEKIMFDQDVSKRSLGNIQRFMREEMPDAVDPPLIAGVDLNEDGLPEFVVKPSSCLETTELCPFFVLADMDQNVINLLKVNAYRVVLAGSYSHGVRDILAFNNPKNDYDYELYIWDPEHSRYTMEE